MKKIFLMADTEHKIAKQVYINISTMHNIQGIISDNPQNTFFKLPVYTLEEVLKNFELDKIMIVICDSIDTLQSIRTVQMLGLKLLKNWIPHWLAGKTEIDPLILYEFVGKNYNRFEQAINEIKTSKKIIIIYGNCQTVGIRYYLEKMPVIKNQYVFFIMPQFWIKEEFEKYELLFKLNVFHFADILITQNISVNNKFGEKLATENVLKYISENCQVIKIANVFSSGYYPQFINKEKINVDLMDYIDMEGLKTFKNQLDYNVCKLVYEGKTLNEIISIISGNDFYSPIEIYNNIWSELEKTKNREKNCDIGITDYIEDNYTKKILFESDQHPTEDVFLELCKRIVIYLGFDECIPCDLSVHAYGLPEDERTPIYPSILKCLGLYDMCNGIVYKLPTGKKVMFNEYMRSYIRTVFPLVKDE